MRLGNQGFDLKEMIIYTCLLFLLLIFVAIEINSFYKNLPEPKEPDPIEETTPTEETKPNSNTEINYSYYYNLEKQIEQATQNYLNDNPYNLDGEILTVDTTTLINLGYLQTLYSQDNTSLCQGYSNIYKQEDGTYVIKPYITCYNYQTTMNN